MKRRSVAATVAFSTLWLAMIVASQPAPVMPGRLVNIGTHRLHLWCEGAGSPAVILEAGLGGYSVDWSLVAPALAQRTRVCFYDRASYAWSDRGPEPRGLGTSVRELHTLLRTAAVSPPYVLVGQSWGGRIVRVYADKYPHDVAGMVLIDTYSEGERDLSTATAAALDRRPGVESPNPSTRLAADRRAARDWASRKPRQQDISDPDEPEVAIAATTARAPTPLGDKPLIVISAGRLSWDKSEQSAGTSYEDALLGHVRAEAFLASLSRNSRFVVARASFHQVHLYEPALVAGAIEDVLAAVRTGARLGAR